MKKEVLFAIVVGISIGLVFAFGTWRIATKIKGKNTNNNVQVTPPSRKDFRLTIDNIENNQVFFENPIKANGVSKPESHIIVSTTEKDYYIKSDNEGGFEIEFELPPSISLVKFTSFSEDAMSEEKLELVHSSEIAKYYTVQSTQDEQQATSEADTVREIVLQKSRQIPTIISYTGTVTDITAGTIQIRSGNGEILQASTTEETSYLNNVNKPTEVKISDLAIGDYVVAMGDVNGNKVLNTKRVIVTKTSSLANNNELIFGELTKKDKSSITITNGSQEEKIQLPKSWVGPNLTELEIGSKLILVGLRSEKSYTLRTIFTPVE